MSMRWIIPVAAVLLLVVAAACGGGGDDDPAPAALSESAEDGQNEGPSGLPPVSSSSAAGDCIVVQGSGEVAVDAEPGFEVEPGSDGPVLEVPLTVESLPNAAATADAPPATSELVIERDGPVAVTNPDECDEVEPEPRDPDAPILDGPATPVDPPIRSDEAIDPDECNLVHNIDACSPEEIEQGFPDEPAAPPSEPEG